MRLTRTITALALAAASVALLASGCANYRLGTGGTPSFSSLYIAPVSSTVILPQARQLLSAQIREAFVRDGRVSLQDGANDADAVLEIALVDYHRAVAANREDDTGLARKFTLFLTAKCRLRDARSGRTLFADRLVTVHQEAFVDNGLNSLPTSPGYVPYGISSDQLQSEYNELPQLGRLLADRMTHTVLDVW